MKSRKKEVRAERGPGGFRVGTAVAAVFRLLSDGQYHSRKEIARTCSGRASLPAARIRRLQVCGKSRGWIIESKDGKVRMVMSAKAKAAAKSAPKVSAKSAPKGKAVKAKARPTKGRAFKEEPEE